MQTIRTLLRSQLYAFERERHHERDRPARTHAAGADTSSPLHRLQ